MSDPMRVLLLTSGWPPTMGGAETYAYTLAEGLAERGHEVVVATDRVAGTPVRDRVGTVDVLRFGEYHDLIADPSKLPWEQLYFGLLPELAARLDRWRPDVVVANSMETTVVGRILAAQWNLPLVGSYHEHAPQDEPFGAGKMAMAYGWLRPDLVLAGSRSYAERALRHLPAHMVRLIHHGVDTRTFRPDVDGSAFRARYGITRGETLVVNAGRLKPRKGQLGLIHAFAALGHHDGARMVIAGDVSSASLDHAALLESEIDRLGLRDRVRIDREVGYAEMPALLAAADVVAQPSLSEGLGLSLIEAMSSGRATVATRIAGFDEIVTRDGLVEQVDPDRTDQLTAALDRLLGDHEHRALLADSGRRHVVEHFSRTRMLERTEQALREAVGGRPS